MGIAETVGNAITFRVLTASGKIILRSVVRSATKEGIYQNLRANERAPDLAPKEPNAELKLKGQPFPIVVSERELTKAAEPQGKTSMEGEVETVQEEQGDKPNEEAKVDDNMEDAGGDEETDTKEKPSLEEVIRSAMEHVINKGGRMPTLNADHILGRTFITTPDEEGEQKRAKIIDIEATGEKASDGKQPLFKFKCAVGEDRFEEIMTYNRMLEWIEQDQDKDEFFRILGINGHKMKNGKWHVLVEWASGLSTLEPLAVIAADDPITVAMYAKRNNLLEEKSWKHLKPYVKSAKKLGRMANQVKLKNSRMMPVYKYGEQVPRNHREAVLIDERNGNTRWQDSEELEVSQLMGYDSFKSLGKGAPIPEGYTKIPCHFVYNIKHCGRYKSLLVAGGHKTSTPVDSTYSGVVSLQGIRIITFLAELNDLELWNTDIGNAYLESYTKEKVCFVAGPEFGKYEGHTMIILKAQYGLKTSGKCWHDKMHDTLRDMGFTPSKAEEDIWMRDMGDHYEYIAVYVDDLMIASRMPQAIIDTLTSEPINFKLKGTGPVEFHLGCNYFRDKDGVLCMAPIKYIDRMIASYKTMFGEDPKLNVHSPLENNDHPELDDSEPLDLEGIAKYQSLIGILQWTISLGRFDIATSVMSMSSYRVAPKEGHLQRLRRICGYLRKFQKACIRVKTEIPDYSDLPVHEYDWARTVYGDVKEQFPEDAPPPKGKVVRMTTYKDANLYHDLTTGRAVTGVIHFLNQTPIEWYTKKQTTVETATYGSEFASARVAIQQIAGLRLTLQYLGVPIERSAYLFGDNESVVKSASMPHSQLSKRHHALAYHYTREAIASKMVIFSHIPSGINVADILSKHWGHSQVYDMLRPIFFYEGDTMELIDEDEE